MLTQIRAKKRRGEDARMLLSLIDFLASFSIFYIPHNYVIPQTMPHAIPQTHSSFIPHRKKKPLGSCFTFLLSFFFFITLFKFLLHKFVSVSSVSRAEVRFKREGDVSKQRHALSFSVRARRSFELSHGTLRIGIPSFVPKLEGHVQ